MADGKRYYWLKLQRDFFKRHDTVLLKKIYGSDALLFYLELMAESVDHEGELRYSAEQPYTAEMLRVLFEEDRAEEYIEILKSMGLLKIKRDKTIVLPKVQEFIGSGTDYADQKRRQRQKKEETQSGQQADTERTQSGQRVDNVHESKRLELDKELDKEIEKDNCLIKKKDGPTKAEAQEYILASGRKVNINEIWEKTSGLTEYKGEPIRDWKKLVDKWAETDIAVPF